MEKSKIQLLSRYRLPIMGFATLWILVFHVWKPVLGQWDRLLWIENFIKGIGFCGVDIFLLVSGLGLVYAIEKYDLKTFYLRRFFHVYPAFLFAAFGIGFFRGWSLKEILEKVLLIRFFGNSIYSYLWYVPAALLFYLFFPLYYRFFKRAKNKYWFVMGTFAVWYVLSIFLDGIMRRDFYGITNRIPIFVVGVLIGWLIQNEEIEFKIRHWILAVIMLGIGVILAYLTTFKEMYLLVPVSNCCLPNFCMALALCFLLANLFHWIDTCWKKPGKTVLKVFSFFGGLSLPLYCIQEYIHTDIMKNPPTNHGYVLNLILFACIIAAGLGLHYFCKIVEKMFEKLGKIHK